MNSVKRFLTVTAAALLLLGSAGFAQEPASGLIRMEYPETFAEVLEQFKGRVVYVDMMASWCVPCINQLPHVALTEDFFVENNIAKLYISGDVISDIDKCFEILKEHGIKGWFLSYKKPERPYNLESDYMRKIEDIFFDAKREESGRISAMTQSFPRYVIIDKNGSVVEHDAVWPSNPEALKEQLSKYL